MQGRPVMFVDPDGNEPITIAILVGALIFGSGNLAIQAKIGNINSWSDGFLAFGKGAALGAAIGSGFGKLAVAKGWWGLSAGAKAGAAKTGLLANKTASLYGGGLNMVNNFDPEKGVGLHTLGHFAAGYIGTQVGMGDGKIKDAVGGFFVGGILNAYTDMASGSIDNGYRMVQSFVGGGLSSLAGSSFGESVKYKWDLAGKSGKEQFAKYGLQNVASNFAYDKKQEFFKKPFAIHGAAFMMGGIGASMQGGIMGGNQYENEFLNFSKRFGFSMLSYGAEYSSNYFFKTKMQQVKYGDFQKNKGASFGVKGFSYSWLYTWY